MCTAVKRIQNICDPIEDFVFCPFRKSFQLFQQKTQSLGLVWSSRTKFILMQIALKPSSKFNQFD